MPSIEPTTTRWLTIELPEADWQALRVAEPDAVGWLQARIRERLASPGGVPLIHGGAPHAAPDWAAFDEY